MANLKNETTSKLLNTCFVCKKELDPSKQASHDIITINKGAFMILCPECMWHFREMFGKLLEERRTKE